MIILKKVNRIYGTGEGAVHALKDIDLVIEDGKFTCILGKSGSGKSTLMNIIGALDTPTSGKVFNNETFLYRFRKCCYAINYCWYEKKRKRRDG